MELRTLFSSSSSNQNHTGKTIIESHASNGNNKNSKSSMNNASNTFNGLSTDNCSNIAITAQQSNLRSSLGGFYSRLPPLNRSSIIVVNSNTDGGNNNKHKEPSENKINCLYDNYKVNIIF